MEERSYEDVVTSRRTYAERLRLKTEAFFIAALCFILGMTSAAALPLTWDEGDAFFRAKNVAIWTEALIVGPSKIQMEVEGNDDAVITYERDARAYFGSLPSRAALFSKDALQAGFPHTTIREGHPAGYSIALALGEAATAPCRAFVSEKQGYRCVGIALFAAAIGGIYWSFASRYGRFYGAIVALTTLSCPRVFGHVQIAGGDSLLISSWLFAWILYEGALRSKRGAALWGLALGASFSAKFSGFLLPVPFAAALVGELAFGKDERIVKREKLLRFALGVLVGLGVFFVLDPPLWNAPFSGLMKFWSLNTTREGFDIPVFFLGNMYSPSHPLPWWNGLFWIAIVVPAPILIAAALGLCKRVFSRQGIAAASTNVPASTRMYWTALALGLTLPLVRGLPGVPVHDGARLLIASCPFWGALAGMAFLPSAKVTERRFETEYEYAKRARRERRRFVLTRLAAFTIVGVGLFDVFVCSPTRFSATYLSYYNAFIGGVKGAYARGMEPTYYWDALDPDSVCLLQTELQMKRLLEQKRKDKESAAKEKSVDEKDRLLFSAFSSQTLAFYRHWKTFGAFELATVSSAGALDDIDRYAFYIMQFRPSGFTPLDVALLEYATPVGKRVVTDPIDLSFGRKDNEVTALLIYDMDDVKLVLQAMAQ